LKNKRLVERLTNNWPAKILSIVAAILLFLFYRISTLQDRYLSVPLHVITNDAFVPSTPIPQTVRITLRGKADAVFLVHEEDIDAYVDFSGYRAAGIYRAPIKVARKGSTAGSDIEIKVDPLELTVTMEKKGQKSVDVYPNIKGFPAKGYELGQYFLTPKQVEVVGPESKVSEISTITTDTIDLTGKTSDFTEKVGLAIGDPVVHVLGNEQVEFHGVIQKIIIIKTIEPVDVVALDLQPSFTMASDYKTGQIELQGGQLDLESLKPGDVTLDVECSQIHSPGVYTLPVKPSVPLGITVLNFTPERVTLTITRGSTP
jgi:YbbR domain-containing protein